MSRLGMALLALLLGACAQEATPWPAVSADRIAQHTRVLAGDDFLGRGPGQVGGDRAAEYIADRLSEYGLRPPDGSYFQSFPMLGVSTVARTVRMSFSGSRGSVSPRYLEDFVLNPGSAMEGAVAGEGELLFVGYGIDAPESDWDDFDDLDVTGKFLLILVNDPPATREEPGLFGGVAMTYYGRWTYKFEEAARQGALGALIVHETGPAGYPWSVVRGGFSGEQFSLPPDPALPEPARLVGWISEAMARRVLAEGGLDFDDLKGRAARRDFTAIRTGINVSAGLESRMRSVETMNVVGVLDGRSRPEEAVVVTAHYDHFGVGEPIDGDSIYNGAYDNASGTALMLEMARSLADGAPPERSVLFVATGAEEQGLLGAQWYVQSPIIPLQQTVAELNFDEANVWGVTTDISVLGVERSDLGPIVRAHAGQLRLTIEPEAEPEVGTYFRSDHFPFARAGVPSLYFIHGRHYVDRPEGWGDSIQVDYVSNHYHAPSDEFGEDWSFEGAVQEGVLALLTIRDLANSEAWPAWYEGQEFKGARDAMMRAGGP